MSTNLILYAVAYLLGAIPFGLILARVFAKVDIKNSGSKSIGATNVLRVVKQENPRLAKILSVMTVVLDALKGVAPILVARYMGFDDSVQWAMAVLAVLGHCYSPYLGFEGGKGIATGAGVLACFLPLCVGIALIAWFLVGRLLKVSSLASLTALTTLLVSSFLLNPSLSGLNTQAPVLIIAFLVVYKHIPNIKRLFCGEEKAVI
ncbi:glycerol-3-phosphate 1-O-acyltransferase PlsY [Campylobacter sp. 19-13652]|uniref:glycerol-3-phosphate 1-O-acyltransferase PlsY n=1 Tax=Campylobacter sp. 19-13652 TaxID=2840180 RepID=UPI001C74B857|nr:glycerol-3-phosphate 1-O-acyltransferase PlsY [Campylobacter sp. 19-13652]BCX78959.1 glycerol-3-phosphate acyltransferase [Campylobacter sp. 19-13652]